MADFFLPAVSASPDAATVGVGQAAQYSLSVLPVSGFYNTDVKFSCGKLPAGVECSFSPDTVRPDSGGANSTLTLAVNSRSAALLPPLPRRLGAQMAMWLCLPGLALIPAPGRRRKLWLALITAAGLTILLFSFGCGGVSAPGANAAMAQGQSYSIKVTASSSSASFTVPVILRINN
jgi:hypothetical protein